MEYLARPRITSPDLRVWMAEVEFFRTLVRTMVDEDMPRQHDRMQIEMMRRSAMTFINNLHKAETEIMALKKGDRAWEVQMLQKDAELEVARMAEERYRKEREELRRQRTEALQIVSKSKADSKQELQILRNDVMLGDIQTHKLQSVLREMEESIAAETTLNESLNQELEEVRRKHARCEPNNQERLREGEAQLQKLKKEASTAVARTNELDGLLSDFHLKVEEAEATISRLSAELLEAKKIGEKAET